MKHVNDEFWQAFGPGILHYAHQQGKKDFFMFGEVFDDRLTDAGRPSRSHFTTHDEMQAVLDFPFQAAARNFASKSTAPQALGDFFVDDDWYTDADSNAYQLPTFLGNHDMGRIGYFLKQRQPRRLRRRAGRARPARARAHVLLARQPGRLLRRRAGLHRERRRPARPAGHVRQHGRRLAGPRRQRLHRHRRDPGHRTTSTPTTRCTGRSPAGRLTRDHPALRDGAQQVRYASDGARRLRLLPDRPHAAARVRRGAEQQRDRADGGGADLRRQPDLQRVYGAGAASLQTAPTAG